MYAGKCDNCGKEANLMGEYAALVDKETVLEDLIMSDYHVDGDKHYCPDCWSFDDEDNIVLKPVKK